MIKSIIVDDERLARKELTNLLKNFNEIEIIEECNNAKIAKEKIEEHKPDLVFLDINMPGKNGFELLEDLEYIPKVIFTTAFDEFAIKAFEVNALDYLLKPIQDDRLHEAVTKVVQQKQVQSEQENPEPRTTEKLTENDQVFVKDGDKCWFVQLAEIRLFESDGNYIKVYFGENRPMILKSLNNLDERLSDKTFFRASRKHIINLKWVENIESWFNGGLLVTLRGKEKIEISRRQAVKLKDMMSL